MARGRFISKEITIDKKVNSLSDAYSMLAFTWLLTHADGYGRTYGDPAIVKSVIFPRRPEVSVEMVESYINEWHDLGLVNLYEVDDDQYIEFPNFGKHQVGLRIDKEAKSNIPANPTLAGKSPEIAGNYPPKNGLIEVKEEENIKVNGIEVPAAAGAVFSAYEREIGVLTPHIAERLKDASELYTDGWLIDAIKIASEKQVRNMKYIEAILARWKAEGKDNGTRKHAVAKKPERKVHSGAELANAWGAK